jgi:hypothetical protein
MKKISNKKYQEYLELKKWEEKQKINESLVSTYNLEDDIDFPIRNSVAILALADCHPIFSCCGFDYIGQPYHKSHQYGEPYIMLEATTKSKYLLGGISSKLPYGWVVSFRNGVLYLEQRITANPHWREKNSIHFSEEIVIGLNELEKQLYLYLRQDFLGEVILEDKNKEYVKTLKYWQYTPKNPWVITPDSLTI